MTSYNPWGNLKGGGTWTNPPTQASDDDDDDDDADADADADAAADADDDDGDDDDDDDDDEIHADTERLSLIKSILTEIWFWKYL